MNSNLVIVCGDKICFSDYFKKQNGLLNKIDLINFCDIVNSRFIIPLNINNGTSFPGVKIDQVFSNTKIDSGPLSIVVHDECVSETFILDNKLNTTNIARFGDSFYCRSNNYNAETAAIAASFIYSCKYPQFIYSKVFNALGESCPPILVGSVETISKKMEYFNSLENLIVNAEKLESKKTKKYKDIVKEYDQLISNPEKMLGLQRINFSEILIDVL